MNQPTPIASISDIVEKLQNNLDKTTIYELIQGHGRTDMYLHYATVIGDFDRVIEHWVLEEDWSKAIDIINRQVCCAPLFHTPPTQRSFRPTSNCITVSDQFLCATLRKKLWILG